MDPERNKQVVRDVYRDLFNARDLSQVDRFIRDDYVQHNPDLPKGKAGFVEFHTVFWAAIPDFHATINHLVAEGDLVWVYNTIRGTHAGTGFLGLPPTGNKIEYDVVDMFRIRDGKLAEHWDVADTRRLFSQVGAIQGTLS
jgi:predicted SnoaL-like aldol condensation-catalyzing enzyme